MVASDDESQRTDPAGSEDGTRIRRPAPPPPGPPPAWRRMDERYVWQEVDRANRQHLYGKAQENCKMGLYNKADIYLLKSILLGENGSFYGRDGRERHIAVWNMVNDSEMTSRMEDHHVINHVIRLLQESDPQATCAYPPWVKRLLDPSRIRHS
eukprot:6149009-Karenia_brevis.AAC.1